MSSLYSSFFMSGFQHASTSTSITPTFPVDEDDLFVPDFRRRGSLPTDESASVEKQLSVRKPKSKRERSWLSLDLASQRSSLRSMPSPKPIPSMCLPALPECPSSPTPSSILLPTPTKSTRVSFAPKPTIIKRASVTKPLTRTNSIVTTTSSTRRARRSDALARLEGKVSHWDAVSRKNSINKRSFNFMSMSDDEDDEDECESFFDVGFDMTSSGHGRSQSAPDVPLSPTDTMSCWVTSPISPTAPAPLPAPTKNKRRRSLTVSGLLTSFIDLDGSSSKDAAWRGRSFIEIAAL
ncbi:hypothetical protein V5O48_004769 [Marasmius crinis-equi]|uniref:Uncharacterized protein n=1 Tax=Marasmius crinis-equi TaxID=585013 RepID=A0ABR3FP55_9AGAR